MSTRHTRSTGVNTNDRVVFAALLDPVSCITPPNGSRRKRPAKVHPDKADDIRPCRQALTRRHIKVRIARKGTESSQLLGRHRWVVERTLAWIGQFRRLTIRSEQRVDIYDAFLTLGCAVICFRSL